MLGHLLAVTSVTAVAAVLLAGTAAAAQPPGAEPVSGDDRATAHPGNVVAADCAELFPGSSALAAEDFTYSVDDTNTYVDITAIAPGVEVVGVVVKGGPAYNVYDSADLGDLAWNDLHSPLVSSGKPAEISHWFACGDKSTPSTPPVTTTTTETGSTSTTSTTDTSVPSGSTTTRSEASSGAASVTTTTPAGVVPAAADEDDLASTGFNSGWLIALAAVLLLGGGALLLILRLRTTRR